MSYTREDHREIVQSLSRMIAAIEAGVVAISAGDAEETARSIERARAEKSATTKLFPAIIINETSSVAFEEVYPDLYQVDLLIIVTFQWPDLSPTPMTQLNELVDAFAETLTRLRELRRRPWAPESDEALESLDELIDKTDELRKALDLLAPGVRLDPRRYTWLGQEFKARFLNGVGDGAELGTMYGFLFALDHAIERARWSVANRKMPGAQRRLVEAKRIHGLVLDWMEKNEPTD